MQGIIYRFYKKIIDKQRKMLYNKNAFGVMAQLVERLVRNEEASGSNPLSSTKKSTSFDKKLVNFYSSRKAWYVIAVGV